MHKIRLRECALYGATLALLALPAAAQQDTKQQQSFPQDPHAWRKEQIDGKINPSTGEPIPQTAGTNQTSADTSAPQTESQANESLRKSLGSVDQNYRGKHKWFADDFMGNLFDAIGPINLIVIAVAALISYFAYTCGFKKGKESATKKD